MSTVENKMQVVYVDGEQPEIKSPSIFLAGPTPRDSDTPSWRPDAIEIFKKFEFDGQIFVPEHGDYNSQFEYYNQVEWEWNHLHGATVIMFWVPRELKRMPAFTTNVEFGFYLSERTSACVYGRPNDSAKNSYLDWLFEKVTGRKPETILENTIAKAIEFACKHK